MPETRHPVEPEELMAYLDGELPADRAAEAAGHLDRCADCQRLAADLSTLSRHLLAWEVEAPQATIPSMPAAEQLARWGWWGRRFRLPSWRWMALAGAAVCVVLIVGVRQKRPAASMRDVFSIDGPLAESKTDQVEPISPAPMIARSAQLILTSANVAKARAALDEILARHHGYIGRLNITTPSGSAPTLQATLRVPAAELAAALSDLKKLGRVEQESQSGEEVTRQYVDLEARLTNARNAEQRLTTLLRDRTGKMQDVLSVENEITRVRGQIETMEAEKKTLGARVEFASIQVTVAEEYKAGLEMGPGSSWTRLRNAAVEGYRNMLEGLFGLAQFVLSIGPSLLIWALLLFWPVRAGWRRLRRSR